MDLHITSKEQSVIANALNSKRKQLELDIAFEYTPNTKTGIRKMLRLELKYVRSLIKKIPFVNLQNR